MQFHRIMISTLERPYFPLQQRHLSHPRIILLARMRGGVLGRTMEQALLFVLSPAPDISNSWDITRSPSSQSSSSGEDSRGRSEREELWVAFP